MKQMDLFEHLTWRPLHAWGFTDPFWNINLDTVLYTGVALAVLIVLIILGRLSLRAPNSSAAYITKTYVRTIRDFANQIIPNCASAHVAFALSLFTFILICNCLVILPGVEEPTKDLNTTFAFAIISFLYIQIAGIRAHGIIGYGKEFFKPFFIMFPLEVLSKLTTVVSLAFRLFGNIFGGSIITTMWHNLIAHSILGQLAGIALGVNLTLLLFFGIFEGLVQAFVFSILSLTYLSMTIQEHHE